MAEDSPQRFRPRIVAFLDAPRPEIVTTDLRPDADLLEEELEVTEWEAEESRHGARVRALLIAFGIHLVAIILAMLVVVYQAADDPPSIMVDASSRSEADRNRPDKVIEQRSKQKRPSAASAAMIPAITASAQASMALPAIDDLALPTMDLGIGMEGNLMGMGNGRGAIGGAAFLGLSVAKTTHVILLIDVSGSMRGNCGPDGLEAIKREAAKTVNSLNPKVQFNIFAFASDVDGFKERSVPATPAMKKAAIAFIDGYFRDGPDAFYETRTREFGQRGKDDAGVPYVPITGERFGSLRDIKGTTRVELGVIAAIQARPKTLFVLSDGEPESRLNGRRLQSEELIDIIDREYQRLYFSRGGLQVGTISIDGQGAKFLRSLAKEFGGVYKSISPRGL